MTSQAVPSPSFKQHHHTFNIKNINNDDDTPRVHLGEGVPLGCRSELLLLLLSSRGDVPPDVPNTLDYNLSLVCKLSSCAAGLHYVRLQGSSLGRTSSCATRSAAPTSS